MRVTCLVLLAAALAGVAVAAPAKVERRSVAHPSACVDVCSPAEQHEQATSCMTSCIAETAEDLAEVHRNRRDWEWNPDTKKYEWVEEVSVEKDKKKKKKKKAATTTTTTKAKKDKKRRRKNKKTTTTKKVKVTTTAAEKNKADVNDVEQLQQAFLAADYNPGCDTIRLEPGEYELDGLVLTATECLYIEAGTSKDAKAGTEVIVYQNIGRHIEFAGNGSLHITGITFVGAGWADLSTNETGSGGINFTTVDGSFTCIDCVFIENTINTTGGAINIVGSVDVVTLDGCVFKDNQANEGGAVYIEEAIAVYVKDTEFYRNQAQDSLDTGDSGGGMYIEDADDVVVMDSTFIQNGAYDGGGFYVETGNNVAVSGSHFSHNTASDYGAAFAVFDVYLSVTDCSFEYNVAYDDGGAIYAYDIYDSEILNTIFSHNFAYGDGTAAYLEANDRAGAQLVLKDITLTKNVVSDTSSDGGIYAYNFLSIDASYIVAERNSGYYGSALHLSGASSQLSNFIKLSHSKFSYNWATDEGGAVSLEYAGYITIEDCEFHSNTAGGGEGGAIYSEYSSIVNLRRNKFTRNLGYDYGGALYFDEIESLFIGEDNEFAENRVIDGDYDGGDAYLVFESGEVGTFRWFRNTHFDSYASEEGGALYVDDPAYITVKDTTVTHAFATTGAGFYFDGSLVLIIDSCTFKDLHSEDDGTAVYSDDAVEVFVLNSVFEDSHTSDGDGGALYFSSDDNVIIQDSKFHRCSAQGDGGAVYLGPEDFVISNCEFIDCKSSDDADGAAVYASYSDSGLVTKSIFSGCQTDGEAALYMSGDGAVVSYCVFENNFGFESASALYVSASETIVSDSAFYNNIGSDSSDVAALYLSTSETSVLRNSFVGNVASTGSSTAASVIYFTSSAATFRGNLVYGNSLNEQRSDQSSVFGATVYFNVGSNDNVRVDSNTFVHNNGGPYTASAVYSDSTGNEFINNLVCNNPGQQISVGGGFIDFGYNIMTNPNSTAFICAEESTICDPDFDCGVGELQRIYRKDYPKLYIDVLPLKDNSPAIENGQPCSATLDIVGTKRPQGRYCDVGSWESSVSNDKKN